jgi:hypothetical protein
MVNKAKKHSVSRRSMIGLSAVAVAAAGAYFYLGYLPGHTSTTSTPTSTTSTTTSTTTTTTTPSSSTSYSSSVTSTTSTIPSTTTNTSSSSTTTTTQGEYLKLAFESSLAKNQPSSDIFIVNGTTGQDNGFETLIELMGKNNLLFYNSAKEGQEGLIAKDDVLLIKVNSQWNERGGTNTDLLKAIIEAIKGHPDGFVGEIVVADNGQGGPGRGSLSDGGHFDYEKNNAEDVSQSVQKVVDSSTGSYKISTYLWDNITLKKVEEYSKGDLEDGYVVQENVNEKTGIQVSYPKFKTKYGTYISFKRSTSQF